MTKVEISETVKGLTPFPTPVTVRDHHLLGAVYGWFPSRSPGLTWAVSTIRPRPRVFLRSSREKKGSERNYRYPNRPKIPSPSLLAPKTSSQKRSSGVHSKLHRGPLEASQFNRATSCPHGWSRQIASCT